MRVRPLFAWYDLWVGVFIDRGRRRVYVLPLPCVGIVIDFGHAEPCAPGMTGFEMGSSSWGPGGKPSDSSS